MEATTKPWYGSKSGQAAVVGALQDFFDALPGHWPAVGLAVAAVLRLWRSNVTASPPVRDGARGRSVTRCRSRTAFE